MPDTDEELLLMNVKEVAELLRCSVRKVWRLNSSGELTNIHIGRNALWRRSAVNRYIRIQRK